MRDVKPQVNFKSLEIDGTDVLPHARYHAAKRQNKGLTIFLVALITTGIIAGGFGIYLFILKTGTQGDTSIPETYTRLSTDTLTAKILVSKAKAVSNGEIKEKLQSTDGSPYFVFKAPAFQPKGYNFSVFPVTEYGFGTYGTKTIVANDLVYMQKVLIDNDLSEKILDIGNESSQFAALYESPTIICLVTDSKPYGEPANSPNYSAVLACANKSDYLDVAAGLRQYFIVYSTQSAVDSKNIVMTGPTIKQSKTAGYSTATVGIGGSEYGSVGGFAGLFYATPDGTLHYFTGTQNELSCDSYNTPDLKRAYLGENCYVQSSNTESKVTL